MRKEGINTSISNNMIEVTTRRTKYNEKHTNQHRNLIYKVDGGKRRKQYVWNRECVNW